MAQVVKKKKKFRLPMQETLELPVQFLGQKDPLEEGMATHSSILACRIPWTEEPGRLTFNFMAAVTMCSDFGAPKNKV